MDRARYLNRVEGHALVLGGSGGIGSEIVRALAASGASAVSFSFGRNRAAAEALSQELATHGIRSHLGPVDRSDATS